MAIKVHSSSKMYFTSNIIYSTTDNGLAMFLFYIPTFWYL